MAAPCPGFQLGEQRVHPHLLLPTTLLHRGWDGGVQEGSALLLPVALLVAACMRPMGRARQQYCFLQLLQKSKLDVCCHRPTTSPLPPHPFHPPSQAYAVDPRKDFKIKAVEGAIRHLLKWDQPIETEEVGIVWVPR